MSEASDTGALSSSAVLNEEPMNSFQPRDGLGSNHIAHAHKDPMFSNSLASSSPDKTHLNHADCLSRVLDSVGTTVHDDSGHISKAVVTGCSARTCDDTEEDRPGSFDYMPNYNCHVKIAHVTNPYYDEEVKLDPGVVSLTVESPLGDSSVASDESTAAVDTVLPKDAPQPSAQHEDSCWDYMPHNDDRDMEDEDDEGDRDQSSASLPYPRTIVRQVDDCVSYNLRPLNGPVTGHQPVIPVTCTVYQNVFVSEGSQDKKQCKDDSDKPDVSGQLGLNGNPRFVDPTTYLPMRQWPVGKSENSLSASLSSYNPITIPRSHGSSGTDPNAFDRKKERKRMKLERLKGTPAEEYKGYRKFTDIKDILAFVEGSKGLSKTDSKCAKKKQERCRKKDLLNGPLTLEDSAGGEDAPSREEFEVTSHRPAPRAMGNSFRRSVGEDSISKSWSEDDDVNKNSNEFHDCLNSLPADIIISRQDQQEQLNDRLENNITNIIMAKVESKDNVNDEKQIAYSNKTLHKKSAKTKNKIDKQEDTCKDGFVLSKSSKPADISERKDLLQQTSAPCDTSIRLHNSMEKEPSSDVKREDSFTEVKKKKKRTGGKDINTGPINHSFSSVYHSYSNNGHHYVTNVWSQTNTPPLAPPSSSSAAVSNSNVLPASGQNQSSRDLSPSAFPVLSGQQGFPAAFHADARRNSCGDINSDCTDSKTYDSDKESAKSLPAAHGARTSGDMSSIYLVSYAKIAAAPRRSDITASPNSESSSASLYHNNSVNVSVASAASSTTDSLLPHPSSTPAVTPERKTTVWKGSRRERRHSIGSSPEDKADGDKSSVTERNRQCGSQEVLSSSIVKLTCPMADDATVSVPVAPTETGENSSSLLSYVDLQKQSVTSATELSPNQVNNTIVSGLSQSPDQTQSANIVASADYATASSQTGPGNTFASSTFSQPSHGSVDSVPTVVCQQVFIEPNIIKSRHKLPQTTSTQSSASSVKDNNLKTAINKNRVTSDVARKHSNTKSVIFLDKRFNSGQAQNLGITFGFDSSYVSKNVTTSQPAASQQAQTVIPSQPQSLLVIPSSLQNVPSCQQQSSSPVVSQEHSNIPSAVGTAAATLQNLSSFASSPCKSNDTDNYMPKGPHIHGPRNGLILSSRTEGTDFHQQTQVVSSSKSNNTSSCNINHGLVVSSVVVTGNISGPNSDERKDPAKMHNSLDNKLNEVTTVPHVAKASAATAVGTAAPSNPQLAHPQAVSTLTVENPASSSLLPSSRGEVELPPEHQGVQGPVINESTTLSVTSKTEDGVLETSTTEAAATEAASQQQSVTADILSFAKPVLYGLQVRPGAGCGKLLFVPSVVSKKNRGNAAEVGSFLRKKWLEDVVQTKGSAAFVPILDD